MRAAAAALVALAGALALGCLGGDDDIDLADLLTPTPTPTPTAAGTTTATPSATPTATATAVPTATPTPSPSPTPTATGTPTSPSGGEGDAAPLSIAEVRAAVEGAGAKVIHVGDRASLCAATSVPGELYWVAGDATDFGPVFEFWAYASLEALRTDWMVEPGLRPELAVPGCELPTGFVWWNENVVMTFAFWLSAGSELPLGGHTELPTEQPAGSLAIETFLGLAP